jgi:beta-exotoxin I transport system permease protein
VNAPLRELVVGPLRAMRRAIFWWSVGLASLVGVTVAFWPAFQGSSGISAAIDQLPAGLVQAFGLENFGTPAGFLRGNLYDFFVPLLLAVAAVVLVNGQTAGEEASGRLELYLAQPIDRRMLFLGRAIATLVAVAVITVAITAVQVGADEVVGMRIESGYLLSTIALCALLAVFHGSLALAIAGLRGRPSLVMGIGLAAALAGCLVVALFPLSSVLAPWQHLSPWDWALGGGPLERATEVWRYLALAVPSVVLAAIGVISVARRDVAAA